MELRGLDARRYQGSVSASIADRVAGQVLDKGVQVVTCAGSGHRMHAGETEFNLV
jgi:hypothetical protein